MVERVKGQQGDYTSPGRRAAVINQALNNWAKKIIEKIKEFKKTGDKKLFVSKMFKRKRSGDYLTNREASMLRKANQPKDIVAAIAKAAGITVPEFKKYQDLYNKIVPSATFDNLALPKIAPRKVSTQRVQPPQLRYLRKLQRILREEGKRGAGKEEGSRGEKG